MANESLRAAWDKAYKPAGSLTDGLFHGIHRSRPQAFPFRSVRSLISAADWPTEAWVEHAEHSGGAKRGSGTHARRTMVLAPPLVYRGKDPSDYLAFWTDDVNGISHDDTNWYFVQKSEGVSRIPVSVPLRDAKEGNVFRSPTGELIAAGARASGESLELIVCKHAGAHVFSRGFLYVPVEETRWPGREGSPAQIWVVNPTNLEVVECIRLENGYEKAPWCAVNEGAGLLYTSNSYTGSGPGTSGQLRVYRWVPYSEPRFNLDGSRNPWRPEALELLGTQTLVTETGGVFPAEWVQAAIVTPNNHLLMICDTATGHPVSGLHLFDLVTGVRRWHVRFSSEYLDSLHTVVFFDTAYKADEVEALTVWKGVDPTATVFVAVVTQPTFKKGNILSVSTGYSSGTPLTILRFDTATPEQRDFL